MLPAPRGALRLRLRPLFALLRLPQRLPLVVWKPSTLPFLLRNDLAADTLCRAGIPQESRFFVLFCQWQTASDLLK